MKSSLTSPLFIYWFLLVFRNWHNRVTRNWYLTRWPVELSFGFLSAFRTVRDRNPSYHCNGHLNGIINKNKKLTFARLEHIYIHWRRKWGARGACAPPLFWLGGGGNGMFVPPPPPLLTPHFYFPLELYVYITLTNNNLAFLIYQLIILWTITIKWHRWLSVNNHISNYNSFILVLYRRYINHVSLCPPPPPHTHTHTHSHTFWHLATPLIYIYIPRPLMRNPDTPS